MTTVECAVLAFKLLAVWLAANGLIGMAHVPAFWTTDQAAGFRGAATLAAAFPSTLSIVLAGLVWLNASWLAARVFVDPEDMAARVFGDGPEDPPVPRGVARLEPFFALALSVIGVLMVVEAAPLLIQGTTLFALSRRAGSTVLGPDLEQRAALWNAAAMAGYAGAWTRLLVGVAMLAAGAAGRRVRPGPQGAPEHARRGRRRAETADELDVRSRDVVQPGGWSGRNESSERYWSGWCAVVVDSPRGESN